MTNDPLLAPIYRANRYDRSFLLNHYSFAGRRSERAEVAEFAGCADGNQVLRGWQIGQGFPPTPTCLDFPVMPDD
jgi:hypothetical protein